MSLVMGKIKNLNCTILNFRYNLQITKATFSIILKKILFGSKKWKKYLSEKYCIYDKKLITSLKHEKSIVIIINSLEIIGMGEFCRELKKLYKSYNLIIATDNFDSYEISKRLGFSDLVIFTPWDFYILEKKFIEKFKVKLVIFVAKIFHPKFVDILNKKNICVGLVSGLFFSYWKNEPKILFVLKRIFSSKTYEKLDFLSLQTEECKRDLLMYIKRKDIHVLGDIRQDMSHTKINKEDKKRFYSMLKLKSSDKIIIAAATAFDEEFILNSYKIVLKKFPDLKLILVPRHIDRSNEILKIISCSGLKSVKLSKIEKKSEQIILCDKWVDLGKLYSIANVIIFARTFTSKMGGNCNIMEPSMAGKPIIFGENLKLYKSLVDGIIKKYPQVFVKTSEELAKSIIYFLKNNRISKKVGEEFKNTAKGRREIAIKNARFIYNFHCNYKGSVKEKNG